MTTLRAYKIDTVEDAERILGGENLYFIYLADDTVAHNKGFYVEEMEEINEIRNDYLIVNQNLNMSEAYELAEELNKRLGLK